MNPNSQRRLLSKLSLKQAHPPSKDFPADLLQGWQIGVGVQFDGGAVEARRLEFVGECFDHREDLWQVDFHVKEQAVGVLAVAEGLVGSEGGRSQQHSASGEIEDVAMPVESSEGTRFPQKKRIICGEIG